MILDCHVHISACTPGHGLMSRKLLDSFAFRFMRWRLGLKGADAATEKSLEQKLVSLVTETPGLDAAVVVAFALTIFYWAVSLANTQVQAAVAIERDARQLISRGAA